ncbi:FAD binding domain protein [Aspergillus arachidicola]|uniref:Delta(24)-sterol reductase n=1 Tax=Aspergillus arachidicola TaxID=656916 RepID=A0A2G7G4C7_9EURO|nr:FAD binding domain protein [Aspergillus arachidicola]
MDLHNATVQQISARVKQLHDDKKPFYIYNGSTNSTRPSKKSTSNTIDTSSLNRVMSIDRTRKVALVEPNVPMDMLVSAILPHGFIPPVVMVYPGITVGGGFAGTSGESSSYRHGFFDRTISWVEIVIGNGSILHASSNENSDLFFGAACSFGTLGIMTLLELQLVELPASPIVELTYFPISGIDEAIRKIEELTPNPTYQYLDGIMFTKTKGLEKGTASKELIPLPDYLFRYDRGGFWVGKYAFEYFLFPQTKFMRWILDGISHTRVMYHAVHKSGLFKEYTIQDVAVPYTGAKDLINFLDDSFGKYPLWLCPVRTTTTHVSGLMAQQRDQPDPDRHDMMLSVGVWGPGPKGKKNFVDFNRKLEKVINTVGGQKWLYARTYYTEEEFWSIYDRDTMDGLRQKYHTSYLPSLYQKVKIQPEEVVRQRSWTSKLGGWVWSRWPISGVYELMHTFWHRDYLLVDRKKLLN